MESVSNGRGESEENDGSHLSPTCLRIPHILKKTLEFCSNSELLPLSLVNKQWNFEARSVLKNRRTINAHLSPFGPCKDVAVFASHVQQMKVVPYSGISIYFAHHALGEPCSSEVLDSSIDVILNQLPLKHFAVIFKGHWEEFQGCPALLLVKKVLQDYCEVLETLTVRVRSDFQVFINKSIQHSTFRRLKCLSLRFESKLRISRQPEIFFSRAERMFIKTMVSSAPNLQELHLEHPIDGHKDLLEGSSAVIVVDSEIDPVNGGTRNGLIGDLRLTRMRLEYKLNRYFRMDEFNRIVPIVLQTSRTSLQSLSLESVFAPSFMRHGIPLENVTKLTLYMSGHSKLKFKRPWAADVSVFWRVLQAFDFTRIFPKLTEVDISSSRNSLRDLRHFFEQVDLISQEPTPDRAVNIKHLKINHSPIDVPFLAKMFPDIETLTIENWDGPPPPFGLISEHWVHLKQLVAHAHGAGYWRQNWDSLICGLFPEEIAQLREEDDEHLKAVNIVPVMPSITCMKELRSFTIATTGVGFDDGEEENDPTFIISKVSALIAFSRCPNLSVTVRASSNFKNAWNHMKKYVSVVIVK